jgi:hypothetical protein
MSKCVKKTEKKRKTVGLKNLKKIYLIGKSASLNME